MVYQKVLIPSAWFSPSEARSVLERAHLGWNVLRHVQTYGIMRSDLYVANDNIQNVGLPQLSHADIKFSSPLGFVNKGTDLVSRLRVQE